MVRQRKAIELSFVCSSTLAQSALIGGSWVPSQGVDPHVKSRGDANATPYGLFERMPVLIMCGLCASSSFSMLPAIDDFSPTEAVLLQFAFLSKFSLHLH